MSFSSDVKTELMQHPHSHDERIAQAYGLLLSARRFGAGGIELVSESAAILAHARELLSVLVAVEWRDKPGALLIPQELDRRRVLDLFGQNPREPSLRMNKALVDTQETAAAFLRGLFLSCGSIGDPQKGYHLEFSLPYQNLTRDVEELMGEMDLSPKRMRRGGGYILYFKDSEQIEDFLTLTGAMSSALQIMNVKVYKDIRNKTNRIVNCETANIEKTIRTAARQIADIELILKSRGEVYLEGDLLPLALLRLDNPDMTLQELGALMEPPLSRSGVSRRFARIREMARELEELHIPPFHHGGETDD